MAQLKLLAVFAHPDDESMGLGGTIAKYSAQGVETHLVCASRGERGWAGEPKQNPGLKRLGEIRTKELENAVKILGMKSLSFLDYIDGDVDKANHSQAISKIVTHIRKIKPQVVVTFAGDGAYGHPDHIAISQFTTAAIVCAADSSYQDAENLSTHRVSKLYYMVDSESFVNLIEPFFGEITFAVDDQMRGEVAWKEWMITTRIDIADYCKTAWNAIRCHESQLPTLAGLVD
ncbi:MAG: PIG-L family deacetylase [Anaerolineales bacterium]|nr:PIG-L family deacetylase [Anaerolineales bacterium]